MNRSEAGMLGYEKSKDKLRENSKKQHREAVKRYFENPSICKNCAGKISYKKRRNKFCNSSCSASYNNRICKKKPAIECRTCSRGIENRGAQHCIRCIKKGMHLHNKILQLEDARTNPTRRKFLVKKLGHQCQECKRRTWNGQPIPIELEHIDGNSDNNSKENLTILCPNCHAQTPTYKGKNKGNGRHWRRQRYKEGKSY